MFKRVCGLFFGLLFLPIAAFAVDVELDQVIVDVNGGNLEIGDIVDVTISIENVSANTLTNSVFEQVIPPGSDYQANSATVNGTANESMVIGNEFKKIQYSLGTLAPATVIEIGYQTSVVDSPIYFVESSQNPSRLFTLDKNTGAATLVSSLGGETNVFGLALTADARYVYGVNSSTDRTWKYDLVTGTQTNLGALNLGRNVGVPCLDFTTDGRLIGADSKEDILFEIDLETGQAIFGASLGVDIRGGDCAFGADGNMYVMSNTNDGKGALWVADPVTGEAKEVADVSDTEYFTGLALGTSGGLFGSGTSSDSLWNINASNGAGNSIGSLGIPHGGGDLAMSAGQQITLNFLSEYGDDNGNDVTEEDTVTHTAEPPEVGTKEDIRNQVIVILPAGPMCLIDIGSLVCAFPGTFASRMQLYVDDVVGHHFRKVEDHMGDEMALRELEGDDAATYMDGVYSSIYSPEKANAQTAAQAMVGDWIALYEGAAGACPHEYGLMKQIRTDLTLRQAEHMLGGARYGDQTPPRCALALEDTTIRYGDEIAVGWDTHGGTVVDISPYIGGVGTNGVTRLQPLETTTFTLTLENNGVVAQCKETVIVDPACDIGFSNSLIEQGKGTYLMWNAEGSDSAVITPVGSMESVTGTVSVFPTETTVYTLQGIRNGQVIRECNRTVTVVNAADVPQCSAS